MSRNETTSAIIDGLLKFMVAGGVVTVGLVAPNAVQVLDKPLQKYLGRLDKRARAREWRRIMSYMKKKKLVSENYQHGIVITKSGQKRAAKADFARLTVPIPEKWDKKWRLVFYDIPENHKTGRDALKTKLKDIGFYQLQRSVWVHPFPCHKETMLITERFGINHYVSYVEVTFIDQQNLLKKKFAKYRL